MKVHVLSDLHVEFEDYQYLHTDCDVVVLAGDIHVKEKGISWALEQIGNKPVIYVLGNHEFYGKTYQKHIKKMKELAAGTNIHILEQDTVTIEGVNFLGCTLWTDFELFGDPRIAGYQCQQIMTDYKKIKKLPNYSKIRSIDTAIFHKHALVWLKKELSGLSGQKNVVVTHHGPSMKSVPDYYKNELTTAAYVSALDDFIQEHSPSYWLHGHLHNSSDYSIGGCRVLCNPKGYPGEENETYNPNFTFTV